MMRLKTFFAVLLAVLSLVLSVDTASAVDCTVNGSCSYRSDTQNCSNGSCGPGYCKGSTIQTGCDFCGGGNNCVGPTYNNCSSCPPPCSPSCPTQCGQSDGCSGTCGTSGFSSWSGWTCGGDYNPGSCGSFEYQHDCTRTNACGGTENATFGTGTGGCNECGPYGSQSCGNWTQTYDCKVQVSGCTECGPSYGAWGACTAPGFTRSRAENYNCQANTTDVEACAGSIYGTLFDASLVTNCSTYATQPSIVGAGVTTTGTVNHFTVYPTTTDSSGNYTRGGLPIPETYDVAFSVDTSQYVNDPPKLVCDGSLTGVSLVNQGESVQRRVGLWRIYGGWFQGQGGDVSGEQGVDVTIPATCILAENQASCGSFDEGGTIYTPLIRDSVPVSGTGDPGVVFGPSIDLDLAQNAVISTSRDQALSNYDGREFGYGYYFGQTSRLIRSDWDGISRPASSAEGEILKSSGNIIVGTDWDFGNSGDEKSFILHDGDISVTSNITVAPGSYLGIVASGTITFASNVTQVEGVYFADTLTFASTGDKATELQFVGEGTFVGWSGVQLSRDRGLANNSAPAELFIFRPDFIINAFDGVRVPEVSWQEIGG